MAHSENNLTIEEAGDLLKQAGLRKTISRISVLQYLAQTTSPKSHAEITERLQDHGLENSTIYRSLNDLVEVELLKRFDFGDHVWRFEFASPLAGGTNQEGHSTHFVCSCCGRIECLHSIKPSPLRRQLSLDVILQIDEVIIRGRCANCGLSTKRNHA